MDNIFTLLLIQFMVVKLMKLFKIVNNKELKKVRIIIFWR